ncbi:MAG: anhydro-N-acetylmuramic acid kinase [Ferruginibacter sp.]|nr:anhydro-N-acetylmuramic acid kinase [Ferruginibacter sp.]
MNANITRLFEIASKPARLIVGLMSGTSVDGLDVALCKCSGAGIDTKLEIINFETVPYDDAFKKEVKSVFSRRDADLEKVCLLNSWIALQHANIISACLKKWKVAPAAVDLIASHGQTIYHAPKFLHKQPTFSNATLQIGDGDHIAFNTGIITISDFRQKHIAAGGEGAPLAVYGDYLIFSKAGENRIMLNIGGIANFTFLPGDLDAVRVFSSDTGTGNTLMDAYVQAHFPGKYFDQGAKIASAGKVNEGLLASLKENSFFKMGFPKTTGPELFNAAYLERARVLSGTGPLQHEDMMATLNRFSADTIVNAIKKNADELENVIIYTSGGGMHNPLLMENIQDQLPGFLFRTTDQLAIDPDAKEAVLFAILANECVAGGQIRVGDGKTGIPFVSMGKISFPL